MIAGYKRRTDAVLKAYEKASGNIGEPDETNLTDILIDMMHRFNADPHGVADDCTHADVVQWLGDVAERAIRGWIAEVEEGDDPANVAALNADRD